MPQGVGVLGSGLGLGGLGCFALSLVAGQTMRFPVFGETWFWGPMEGRPQGRVEKGAEGAVLGYSKPNGQKGDLPPTRVFKQVDQASFF